MPVPGRTFGLPEVRWSQVQRRCQLDVSPAPRRLRSLAGTLGTPVVLCLRGCSLVDVNGRRYHSASNAPLAAGNTVRVTATVLLPPQVASRSNADQPAA